MKYAMLIEYDSNVLNPEVAVIQKIWLVVVYVVLSLQLPLLVPLLADPHLHCKQARLVLLCIADGFRLSLYC